MANKDPEFFPAHTKATAGMPCTKVMCSDTRAASVEAVSPSGLRITVREKIGRAYDATLRKDGYYHKVGDKAEPWNQILLGSAVDHDDPHR